MRHIMTPTEQTPLTPEREREIRDRREAVTDTPWGSYRDLGGEYTVEAGATITLDEGFSSTGMVARVYGDSDEQRYRRADFITQAPTDIDRLHTELDRVRAELQGARATVTELTAARDAATAEAESLRSQLADAYGSTAAEWMQTQQQLITTLMARVAELEARPSLTAEQVAVKGAVYWEVLAHRDDPDLSSRIAAAVTSALAEVRAEAGDRR
ncbi:hypothetical protein ACFYMO_03625 [Streptomyces sp. NPDC007025]|uniref:hypothetical protein n=1 Tax=Streptomyces sp. NPDC007025 TaxID=3364771 RepID=UPI0036B0DD94